LFKFFSLSYEWRQRRETNKQTNKKATSRQYDAKKQNNTASSKLHKMTNRFKIENLKRKMENGKWGAINILLSDNFPLKNRDISTTSTEQV